MKTVRIVSIVLLVLSVSISIIGQDRPFRGEKLRARFTQIKINEIGRELHLSPERMAQFRPVYEAYDREKTKSRLNLAKGFMRMNPDSLSDAEAEKLIKVQMEDARRLIDVREKYYNEFRKILSPQEIIKLYRYENDIQRRVMQEMKRRARRFPDSQ